MKKPIVIAEIGCNHCGDINIAMKMISVAKDFCDADVVKFQKRNPKELLSDNEYNAPHPNPSNAYGDTYGAHREYLEFDVNQHKLLQNVCISKEIEYSSSVWDLTSATEIVSLKPKLIKVPSACNLNKELLNYLCENFGGEIHISLGMTSKEEEGQIVSFLQSKGRLKDLVLYSCTSGYPVPFDDICLLEVKRLKETYGDTIRGVGFSGHHLGIAVDSASVALGADYIERHYTLDRTQKGTDHSASLEPDGLCKLVRDVNAVYKSLSYKQDILPIEKEQRNKLKQNSIKW